MNRKLISKDKTLSIRCTAIEKETLERYAKKEEKSLGAYLIDCAYAKYERHRSRDRKQLVSLIETQELLNELIYKCRTSSEEITSDVLLETLTKIYESESKIWQL